jgi:hypothetical protein
MAQSVGLGDVFEFPCEHVFARCEQVMRAFLTSDAEDLVVFEA